MFERAFRQDGLPLAVLTDDGRPCVAPRVWWVRLGIRPLRTEFTSPEQNGAHERCHRTLEAETGAPPRGARSTAAGFAVATLSSPLSRALAEPEYPAHYLERLASSHRG